LVFSSANNNTHHFSSRKPKPSLDEICQNKPYNNTEDVLHLVFLWQF
jgi:hypothetical protein